MIKKTGQYFLDIGKITVAQLREAMEIQRIKRHYLGEILVEREFVTEADLLVYLSRKFGVQYVGSAKLEKLTVRDEILSLIPASLAESRLIFPIKLDRKNQKLTILTFKPQDLRVMDDLKDMLHDIREVVPVIAYSKAIQALVYKLYKGDLGAFERLVHRQVSFKKAEQSNLYSSNSQIMSVDSLAHMVTSEPEKEQESESVSFTQILNRGEVMTRETTGSVVRDLAGANGIPPSNNELIEIFRIFSGLLDLQREEGFRGHTQRVTLLSRKLGSLEKMTELQLTELTIASYLHDVGKRVHLNAFDIQERIQSERIIKYASTPSRLFGTLRLPRRSLNYLSNMYETWDGEGFPNALSREDIPLGAQILLLADTFDYMTVVTNIPRELAFHRISTLGFFKESLLSHLREIYGLQEKKATKISGKALIITGNTELRSQIELQLSQAGIQSLSSSLIETAAIMLKEHRLSIRFILCDLSLKKGHITPLKLLSAIQKKSIFEHIKFYLFSTTGIESSTVIKASSLGAAAIIQNFDSEKNLPDIISAVSEQ